MPDTPAIVSEKYVRLTTYTQDFEARAIASPAALDTDGWQIFANVLID